MADDRSKRNHAGVKGLAALLLACTFSSAQARGAYQCEGLLLPGDEVRATDYMALQAFARVNPTHLYDAISKSGDARNTAGGSFGGFAEDFRQSTSKGEFPKRAQKRLQDENFNLPDVEAKAHYRRGLSDAQLNAWSECAAQTREGAVLVTAREAGPDGFNLVAVWSPPARVGTSPMDIKVIGGTIAGLPSVQQTMTGRSASSHSIRTSWTRPVKVTVSIAGASDSVMVVLPKAATPGAKP